MGALRLVLDVSSHSYMETALIQAWVAPHKGVPVPWQGALLRTSQLSHPTEEQAGKTVERETRTYLTFY